MNLKQKFGIIKKFIRRIFSYLNSLHPKYNLSLDHDFYDFESKEIIYFFKVFGDHSFVQFTFDDIKNDMNILQNIAPFDLIKIVEQETIHRQKRNLIKIKEHLRNNQYKIIDNLITTVLSGDEICENVILMNRMEHMDLYKIAYNTGFIRGRSFAKTLSKEIQERKSADNPVKLELVGRKFQN